MNKNKFIELYITDIYTKCTQKLRICHGKTKSILYLNLNINYGNRPIDIQPF